MSDKDKSERYETADGGMLHIREEDGWEVWLNTGHADFDGLCVAFGDTRTDAIENAVATLEDAAGILQRPPAKTP